MQKLLLALAISGLALSAGPLSLETHAQGYIDVEAERAAAAAGKTDAGSTTGSGSYTPPAGDSYGSAPAQAYPATSYGLNSSAAVAPAQVPVAGSPSGPATGEQNLGNLFYQIQLLQQEVMTLNGKVEEQAHELRKLREQNLERYVDLDRRLGEAGGSSNSAAATAGTAAGANATVSKPLGGNGSSTVAELPGEGEAYRAAYAQVRSQQFDQAISSFKRFLADFPAGKYAPNAHYWLGELYLVIKPADLESSRQSFMLLLDQYPDNSKIPDTLYKLGKVQFMKGNRDRAKEFFDRLISEYGSSNSSAVKLARDFLSENY